MAAIAVRRREGTDIHPAPPVVGCVGALGVPALLTSHLYTRKPDTFWTVLGRAVVVVAVELLHFEREALEEGVETFESAVEPVD